MAIKIFDSDVNKSSIVNEIEQLKTVSNINFAPTLREWDIDERWYQEDYIRSSIASGHRSVDSVTFLNAFYSETVPCMHNLILFQPLEKKDLSVYLKEVIATLENSNFSKEKLDTEENHKFSRFIHSTVEQLNSKEDRPVSLSISHGDFCPANILGTKNGIKLVDWESIGYRSLLYDFFSYFFHRPVSSKIPVDQLVSEIKEALPFFISELSLRASDITDNLPASVKMYRQLYYLEQLCKLVERDMTDNNLSMKDYIFRYIDAFIQYENILGTENPEMRND